MSGMDIKIILRKMDYPMCAVEALSKVESFINTRNKQDFVMELISEFVFLERGKDFDDRTANFSLSTNSQMTLIQEFHLVVLLNEFFSRPVPDAIRNAVFLSLFGSKLTPLRSNILEKLISTAVSGSVAPVLSATGTWMQQLGCSSQHCAELAQTLIKDFIVFSKKISEQLKQLPLVAPAFAANFMTTVANLYMKETVNGEIVCPPDMLLEIISDWLIENPSLCLASQKPSALPGGAIAMPVVTPLAGLIRWTVLSPTINQKSAFSKLHLGLLKTLLQNPTCEGTPTALNSQHLIQIITILNAHSRKLTSNNIRPEEDENFQSSLERFAQAIQVSITSKCIFGSIPQLLSMLEKLPNNTLMNIVIKSNKQNK